MMKGKKKIVLLVLIILPVWGIAQKGPKDFGDVSFEELQLKAYEKDTSAAALILFDKGNLEVDHFSTKGWELTRHIRIKILKPSAVEEWGEETFYVRRNGLKNLQGASYNLENGKVEKAELEGSSVFISEHDKFEDEVNFALPNVKEGSVIELKYTINNTDLYLPRWYFQETVPTLWSEFSFYYASTDIVPHIRGSFEIIQEESKYEGKYQKWVLKDVPAFKSEPNMPDVNAYLAYIEFTSKSSSWLKVYNRVKAYGNYKHIIHVEDYHYLKSKVKDITAGIEEPRGKVKAISDYIKQAVTWNGVHDFYGENPRVVIEKKKGSSGDINLLFAAMLEKAGFKVNLVLVSTRDNGFILEDYPWHGRFNYLLCELVLDDKRLLLDATEKELPFNMLPARCFNHKGFLISDKQYGWIGIEPAEYNKVSVEADLTLSETGDIEGDARLVMSEYAAYNVRKKLSNKGEGEYVNEAMKNGLWNVKLVEQQNLRELDKPVTEKYQLRIDKFATASKDLIYLNPHIFLREDQNPFKVQERAYPVDFDKLEEKVVITKIKIPEGYVVEEIPENAAFALPGNAVKFFCSVSASESQIMVMSRVQVNKTLFQPMEYLALKEIHDKIIEKKGEIITLRRK